MAVKLDAAIVRALPAPASGYKVYYDSEDKGFGCRVTAAGVKSFILNYRAAGIERRMTIGKFPTWSAEQARKQARDLLKRIGKGEDPMKERHDEREAPTVADLIDRFEKDHLPKKRPGTALDYKTILEKLVRPKLGKIRLSDLKHADIDGLHREISKRAPYRANRMAAVVSKMFAMGIKLEWMTSNPAKGIERNQEDRRSRYLTGEELAHLSTALAEHADQRSANAVRLLLLTGARRMEVLAATWDQFDVEAGVWTKPSSHTKQKKEHRVPLSAPAKQLLVDLGKKSKGKYLFPGDRSTKENETHQTDIKKTWDSLTKRATVYLWASKPDTTAGALVERLTVNGDLPSYEDVMKEAKALKLELPAGLMDCRLHDLRHSYASILASAGLSLPVIGALLGHSQPATTARYAHLFDDPLRAATERVGAIVDAAAKRRPSAEVVPLERKK